MKKKYILPLDYYELNKCHIKYTQTIKSRYANDAYNTNAKTLNIT